MKTINTYYQLTKPGIIYGNAITAIAGFCLAAKTAFPLSIFLGMLIGISLVIASACVVNNYIDRDIDKKMSRTKHRALAEGTIHPIYALVYAAILGIAGFFILFRFTNIVTVGIGVVGIIDYIIFYGIAKRTSIYSTIVGSLSGATPIVAGYTAVSDRLDIGAMLLFFILVFWQMPHFYAIGMYRLNDYKNASLPILPVKQGLRTTKIHTICYIIAFIIATVLLFFFGYTGKIYLVVMLSVGIYWLWWARKGFSISDTTRWAKKLFLQSLMIIMVFSFLLYCNAFLF